VASIRTRTARNGETTWAVLYRHGKKQTSHTVASAKDAHDLKTLIDTLGVDRAFKALNDGAPDDRLTVDQLATQFLDWKTRDVTERTMTDYRRDIANWIKPWLGHKAAETVDEGDVQRWVDHMATRLSPKSVADRHMLLHAMYQYGKAKSRGLVTHNPCLETDLPKRVKKPPKGTTVAECRAILEAAVKRNPDAADLILFLAETGWRFSEATALDVRDVEDDGVNVWVNVTRVMRLNAHYRQVVAEDSAKSDAAFRRIVMWPASAAMVRRRVATKRPGDLVFTNTRGRAWSQNTFLRETWPKIIADAQLGDRHPTPHWLRHMHVAVALASGSPIHEVQRRIGHEHYSTTVDVYGGMIGDMSSESVTRAAAIMSGERNVPGVAEIVQGEVIAQVLELD
jgi:integrase